MSVNKLAPFYVAHGHDEAEDLDRPVWLRPGAVFLDAPDGEPLYALRPQESMSNNPIYRADWVSTRSAHVLVDLALRGGQVRGWIRQDELSFDPPGGLSGGGSSSCGGFGATFYGQQGPTVQLSAGTILFADVDGDYVGETTEDHDWFLRDEQDGWTGVQLDTPWGGITAWVMPE